MVVNSQVNKLDKSINGTSVCNSEIKQECTVEGLTKLNNPPPHHGVFKLSFIFLYHNNKYNMLCEIIHFSKVSLSFSVAKICLSQQQKGIEQKWAQIRGMEIH